MRETGEIMYTEGRRCVTVGKVSERYINKRLFINSSMYIDSTHPANNRTRFAF